MQIRTKRLATKEELSLPLETIPYHFIESYTKRIEKRNIIKMGHSTSFGSMHLPVGIIVEYHQDTGNIVIYQGWRKILRNAYEFGINPIMVEKK